jgi:hypothetical protein
MFLIPDGRLDAASGVCLCAFAGTLCRNLRRRIHHHGPRRCQFQILCLCVQPKRLTASTWSQGGRAFVSSPRRRHGGGYSRRSLSADSVLFARQKEGCADGCSKRLVLVPRPSGSRCQQPSASFAFFESPCSGLEEASNSS